MRLTINKVVNYLFFIGMKQEWVMWMFVIGAGVGVVIGIFYFKSLNS